MLKNPSSPGGQTGYLKTRKALPNDWIWLESQKRIPYVSFTSLEGHDEEEAGSGNLSPMTISSTCKDSPSIDNGRNLGKKAVQNTLVSASVPWAFEMQTRHRQDDKVLGLSKHLLEIGGGQQLFEVTLRAQKCNDPYQIIQVFNTFDQV